MVLLKQVQHWFPSDLPTKRSDSDGKKTACAPEKLSSFGGHLWRFGPAVPPVANGFLDARNCARSFQRRNSWRCTKWWVAPKTQRPNGSHGATVPLHSISSVKVGGVVVSKQGSDGLACFSRMNLKDTRCSLTFVFLLQ